MERIVRSETPHAKRRYAQKTFLKAFLKKDDAITPPPSPTPEIKISINTTAWADHLDNVSEFQLLRIQNADSMDAAQELAKKYGVPDSDIEDMLSGKLPPIITPTEPTPSIVQIGLTAGEQAQRTKALEAGCRGGYCDPMVQAYYTPKLWNVKVREGTGSAIVVVEAFTNNAARDKTEDAGYKIFSVTRKFDTEPTKETITPTTETGKTLSDTAIEDIVKSMDEGFDGWVDAVKKHNLVPDDSVAIRVGGNYANTVFVSQETADLIKQTTTFKNAYRGKDSLNYALETAWREISHKPQVELGDGSSIPKESIRDEDGKMLIMGWNDIPERYHDLVKDKGLSAFADQMEKDRVDAKQQLEEYGFRTHFPPGPDIHPMLRAQRPTREGSLLEYTIPNMAKYVRNTKNGRNVLEQYGFPAEVLDQVDKYNTEVLGLVRQLNGSVYKLTTAEVLALKRALDNVGKLGIPKDLSIEQLARRFNIEYTTPQDLERKWLARMWFPLDDDTKIAVAVLYDKDYTKKSYLSSVAKDLQHLSSKHMALNLLLAVPTAILSPIGKQITLEDAKNQLGEDYKAELSSLKSYVNKDHTFNIAAVTKALDTKDSFRDKVLEKTGYKNKEELVQSLEYFNYGTTVTPKEWAIAGLTAGLVTIPFAGKGLSTLGLWGTLFKHGVPAALGAVMMPDTIKMIKNPDISVGNKVLAAAITAALLSGAVIGVGKFAFKELRQFVKPGTFEAGGVSLEVSIPKAQLQKNMTPEMAKQLVVDLERVWGGKLPKGMADMVSNFNTPAEFQQWYSAIVRNGIMSTQIRTISSEVATRAAIKGRQNPFQAAMGNNVLFSVKPDMATYGAIIGKSKTGLDITPKGSMEWWSPNFSGNVVGGYLGRVKQFYPGGKMLRFSPKDIKAIPTDIYISVAKKIQQQPKFWEQWKGRTYMKGDKVTAMNYMIAEEVYRRAMLPKGHAEALPPGIYPVFKFHWSTWPSGKLRPTWELEMVTPAGFKAHTFKPVRHLDKFKTGEGQTPEVAALTVRSPVQGKDLVTGQSVKLGQPMPVIVEATANALAEGKGLPTVSELYAAKYAYRPIAAIQNLFTRGTIQRPRATEASKVTTPTLWVARGIKYKGPKVNPADAAAKNTLMKIPEGKRLSVPEIAAKVERHTPDANGRFTTVRDPYYHPEFTYADNWVVPRTGVMLKHPTIKNAYIVVQDSSRAAQPGVWDIVGGQIDTLGKPRVGRPMGRISLMEAAHEQLLSELGIRAKTLRPGKIHMGKTTEHSAFGTYMFDGTAKNANFKVPMNKWYDMVKGEWVIEPEVGAIGILKPGTRAAVTPSLYVELARRGFDVRNLVVVDKGLPTSGIRQYAKGTFEYNVLKNAKVFTPGQRGAIGINVNKFDTGGTILWASKGNAQRIKAFETMARDAPDTDFIVPTTGPTRPYTGLVPTMRPPKGYSPAMLWTSSDKITDLVERTEPAKAELEYTTIPEYRANLPEVTDEGEPIVVPTEERRLPVTKEDKRVPAFTRYKPVGPIKSANIKTVKSDKGKKVETQIPVVTITTPPVVPVPPRRIPLPTKTTRPLPWPRIESKGEKKRIREGPALATWKQGLYWVSVFPPFRTKKGGKAGADVVYSRKRPHYASLIAKGRRAPMRTLRAMGKIPPLIEVPMGVTTARIKNGRTLSFTRRRTNGKRRRGTVIRQR